MATVMSAKAPAAELVPRTTSDARFHSKRQRRRQHRFDAAPEPPGGAVLDQQEQKDAENQHSGGVAQRVDQQDSFTLQSYPASKLRD